MNTVELLLKIDAGKLAEVPTKTMEIKRLSKMTGQPFMVKIKALSGRRYLGYADMARDNNNTISMDKLCDANSLIVCAGMVEPDMKNKELQEHFGAKTPKDLVEKIFRGGEIGKIADEIAELSGYGKDTDDKVKD